VGFDGSWRAAAVHCDRLRNPARRRYPYRRVAHAKQGSTIDVISRLAGNIKARMMRAFIFPGFQCRYSTADG
jgi:hypothetical protein